jgi:hypothetical protein
MAAIFIAFASLLWGAGSHSILVGVGQGSNRAHKGVVFRILGYRGRAVALLGPCFCICCSTMDRGLVFVLAVRWHQRWCGRWLSTDAFDCLVDTRDGLNSGVGSPDFAVVLAEQRII